MIYTSFSKKLAVNSMELGMTISFEILLPKVYGNW